MQPTLKIDPSGSITAVLDGVEGTSVSPRDCALLTAYILNATHCVEGIHPDSNLTDINVAVQGDMMVITWKQYGSDQRVEYGASSAPYAAALLSYINGGGQEDLSELRTALLNALAHTESRLTTILLGGNHVEA